MTNMCKNTIRETSIRKSIKNSRHYDRFKNNFRTVRNTTITQRPLVVVILLTSLVLVISDDENIILSTNALLTRLNPRRLVSFALSSRPSNLVAEPVQNKLPQKLTSNSSGNLQDPKLEKRRNHARDFETGTYSPEALAIETTRLPNLESFLNSSGPVEGKIQSEVYMTNKSDINHSRNGSAILEDLLQQLIERTKFNLTEPNDNFKDFDSSSSPSLFEDVADDVSVDQTQMPLVQLLTIGDSPQTIEVTSETTTNRTDETSKLEKLQRDFDDRFIHYDTDTVTPQLPSASNDVPASFIDNQQQHINANEVYHGSYSSGLLPIIRASQLEKLNPNRAIHLKSMLGEGSDFEEHNRSKSSFRNHNSSTINLLMPHGSAERSLQARSMGLMQQNPQLSNVPQHSKPPYASYNQFQERANLLRQNTNKNKNETSTPTDLVRDKSSEIDLRGVTGNGTKLHDLVDNNIGAQRDNMSASYPTPKYSNASNIKAEINQSLNILHSIGQISSHLASTNSDSPPPSSSVSLKPEMSTHSIDRATNSISQDVGVQLNRREGGAEVDFKTLRNRLAPASQSIIDLDPIPGSSDKQHHATGDDVSDSSQFYFGLSILEPPLALESLNNDFVQTKRDSDRVLHNDRYFNPSINSSSGESEKPSNRIHDNDLKLTARNRVVSDENGLPIRGAHKLHQASLTNISAPISSSPSPTEAMKSAVDINNLQLPAKQFSYRPNVNESQLEIASSRKPPQRISTSSSFYQPLTDHPATYSAPANQLYSMNTFPKNANANDYNDHKEFDRMRLGGSLAVNLTSPQAGEMMRAQSIYEPNITRIQQASGFRSPTTAEPFVAVHETSGSSSHTRNNLHLSAPLIESSHLSTANFLSSLPSSYLSGSLESSNGNSDLKTTVAAASNNEKHHRTTPPSMATAVRPTSHSSKPTGSHENGSGATITNGFVTNNGLQVTGTNVTAGSVSLSLPHNQHTTSSTSITATTPSNNLSGEFLSSSSNGNSKRAFNLTRVEHISADCSDDLIRAVIIFNGTFKGIIYSSGYVRDPNCLYINGTGKTRYDFSIKLNQCGTLGRQELHTPTSPNDIRRRDQVVWNTLSIQYNPIIEQEWDEHFRVSCEYGSDFWKTISFSPFSVETNTGSPVVFTVNPPQCQMEILRGHSMVGPRQEAVSGPVTVGDPLTLLIHMKSERAGYDILVKNCVAHNGGQQKMQLIDTNGCVVNERFISPFRGTYNDNDLKHVTLYAYLKAFRFTGSPVLYLECEVHMCQSSCPPQMCYWRRLSKRSIRSNETESSLLDEQSQNQQIGSISASLGADLPKHLNLNNTIMTTTDSVKRREARQLRTDVNRPPKEQKNQSKSQTKSGNDDTAMSEKVSLFQALEVRQEREPDLSTEIDALHSASGLHNKAALSSTNLDMPLLCYRRVEVYAFLITISAILIAAISITIGCCLRARSISRHTSSVYHGRSSQSSSCASIRSNSLWNIPSANYSSNTPLNNKSHKILCSQGSD